MTLLILTLPAVGLLVFTQLTLFSSFIFGLDRASIIISTIVTGILAVITFLKFRQKLNFDRSNIFAVFLILPIVLFLSYILITQALFEGSNGLETGGGGMYGDTALHAAYTSRLATGEFPIQNPLFAEKILVYPLANDLLSATLSIFGVSFNMAFALPQIIFLVAFLSFFYKIVRKFTSNFGFVIALLILLLGWGVGIFYFLNEWRFTGGNIWQFLSKDYTDIAQYNLYFHNILTGLILPERSFLPGLVLGLWMFLNFVEYFESRNKKYLIINGIILGSLPFWHTHTFIFFSITALIFALWSIFKNGLFKSLKDFALMVFVSFIFAIPFLYLFLSNHSLGNFIHLTLGWQNGEENIFIFWLRNSFLIIPLSIIGLRFVKKEDRIFFAPTFVIFLLANLIIFQPWEWDNIKLISWSFLFFSILVSVGLAEIYKKNLFLKLFVGLIILISSLSGILSIGLQLKNKYVLYDRGDIELAAWAKTNTKVDEVFVVDPVPNNPISGLAGRLVYIGYPGHLWVHGIDYVERELENNQILSGDISQINNLKMPVSYVVLSKNKLNFEIPKEFNKVYQNQKYLVLENTTD